MRDQVRAVLAALKSQWIGPIHILSALARGAYLLVADVAGQLQLDLVAVVPLAVDAYRAELQADGVEAAFDAALARPETLRIDLPALEADDVPRDQKRHYEQLGALLARRSHIVLALWDGQDEWADAGAAAREELRGGTGHVVHLCRSGTDPALEPSGQSRLLGTDRLRRPAMRPNLVLQIATPRDRNAGALAARGRRVAAGTCMPLWGDPRPLSPAELWGRMDGEALAAFVQMREMNRAIAAFGPVDKARFVSQCATLATAGAGLPDGAAMPFARLCAAQATVDAAAQSFQRRLLGVWVPASSPRHALGNAFAFLRTHRTWPPLGVLSGFAAAVPAAVLFFELYAHGWKSPVALFVYLAILLGTLAYYRHRVKPGEWQNRFQDCRALSEALRVQLFMSCAGLLHGVPDHYLLRQSGELGWIRVALHGPALWGLAVAGALPAPMRESIRRCWLVHQRDYFTGADLRSGRMRVNADAARRGEKWAGRCIGLAVAFALALGMSELGRVVI